MINVKIKRRENYISGFHIEGHSGYADRGSDIICSAISALSINCINSIEEYTDDDFSLEEDEDLGLLDFEFNNYPSKEASLLINSLILGISNIEKSYGSRYVRINS